MIYGTMFNLLTFGEYFEVPEFKANWVQVQLGSTNLCLDQTQDKPAY